ncbi:GIY-YIG nuclease family protein [Oerskovia sp. M15]
MIDALLEVRAPVGVIYGIRLRESREYRYVGLTTKTASRRFRQHLRNAQDGKKTPFCDWLRKHDEEGVTFDILDVVVSDLDELGASEIEWIDFLRTSGDRLLNISDGGSDQLASSGPRSNVRPRVFDQPGVKARADLAKPTLLRQEALG